MNVESVVATGLPEDLVAIGIPVFTGADGPHLASVATAGLAGPEILDGAWCKRQGFTGKVGQTLAFLRPGMSPFRSPEADSPTPGAEAPVASVLVGLGEEAKLVGDAGLEMLRRAAASFIRAAGSGRQPCSWCHET